MENPSMKFVSNHWETAITSQGHVTTANKEYLLEGHFLSNCISKGSAHPSLKLHITN